MRNVLIRVCSSASSETQAPSRRSQTAFADDLGKAGLLSLPVTLAILVVAFGALVAAGIPLLLALTAIFATFGLIAIPSHILPVAQQAPALVLLIGLAVGVDYSMFYLRREREERAAGRSERAAIEAAAATSGRSVLISGLTVMTAMAGMFLTGDQIFESFGVATILVVAIAMLGSLTVLPALLSRLGDGVGRGRVPFVSRLRRDDGEGRIWGASHRPCPAPATALGRPRGRVPAPARRPGHPAQDGPGRPGHVPEVARRREDLRPDAGSVPRHGDGGERRRPGAEREVAADAVRDLAARAACPGERSHVPAVHGRRQPGRDGREHHGPDRGQGLRCRIQCVAGPAAQQDRARDRRRASRKRSRRHGLHGPVEGLERRHEGEPAARRRVRSPVRVRAHARRVPLARDRGQGDRPEPALGRCGLRRPGARLPARRRQEPVRVHLDGRDRSRLSRCSCS